MFQSVSSENKTINQNPNGIKPSAVPVTVPPINNNYLAPTNQPTPMESKTGVILPKVKTKRHLSLFNPITLSFLCILVLVFNLLIGFRLKSQLSVLADIKTVYQDQELLTKAGLTQFDLNSLNSLNDYFLTKDQVLVFTSQLNQEKANFVNLDYTFLGEDPAISGQKYLPMTISAIGLNEQAQRLLEKIMGLQKPIEIIDFQLRMDPRTTQSSLTLKLNLYVQDDFSF